MPKQKPLNPDEYAEEKLPFDAALHKLLQAKPDHKSGEKNKAKKKKDKK